jgi:AcrR family transcriptional regulator
LGIKLITDDFVNNDAVTYTRGVLTSATVMSSPVSTKNVPSAAIQEREPRGARRKRETRARLLEAALQLMAQRGMEGVAINEITEAADVGFGSFYNHFESKEAIYAALVDHVFENFADALDRLVRNVSDPAEVIAISVRHTLMRARHEPVWGQFLIRDGLSMRVMERGLGQRLLRDIQRGIATQRFTSADPLVRFVAVGGTVLAAISAELQFGSADSPQVRAAEAMGFSNEGLPERVAAVVLTTLGLTQREADQIACRPLPEGDVQA